MKWKIWRKVISLASIFLLLWLTFIPCLSGDINSTFFYKAEVWSTESWESNGFDENIITNTNNQIIHVKEDVQLAINKVSENGIVEIHNGSFSSGRSGIQIDKALLLKGQGRKNTTIEGDCDAPYVFIIRSKGVEIKQMNVTGACYSPDSQSTQAGIRVNLKYNLNKDSVKIVDNRIYGNMNGIFLSDGGKNKNDDSFSVNVLGNEISNNKRDGIIINSLSAYVEDNLIINNFESGIDLWGNGYNTIVSNEIFSNHLDGIWIDGSCDNKILGNTIEENKRNGIMIYDFFFPDRIKYSTDNDIRDNIILSNIESGIYIYHGKRNSIVNNTIEDNREVGLKINQFRNFSLFLVKGEEIPSSTDNEIYCNNFINNGKNGKLNALETIPFSRNCWSACKTGLLCGNYWSDFNQDKQYGDPEGIWDEIYDIPFHFFRIPLTLLSKNSDTHPWCRINGWRDGTPEVPDPPQYEEKTNRTWVNIPFEVTVTTDDPNRELLSYQFNYSNGTSNITSEWSDPIESGYTLCKNFTWDDPGCYNIKVRAKDIRRDTNEIIDGISKWSKCLEVTVDPVK